MPKLQDEMLGVNFVQHEIIAPDFSPWNEYWRNLEFLSKRRTRREVPEIDGFWTKL